MNRLLPSGPALACAFGITALAVLARAADVRVFIQFNRGQQAAVAAALAQQGARVHHEFADLDAVAVTLPEQARAALSRQPGVTLIEEDPRRGLLSQTVPYGISLVQADTAVAAGATGAGIKVGVIDSGVFRTHEDLASVALNGEPFYGAGDARNWDHDILSHGTHVVGTLAAANNSVGVLGVSPGAITVHMVKVFGDAGEWVYSSDLLAAARVAVAKGARIISMSLGGARKSRTEQAGLEDLYNNKHALLVAAAGNDGTTAYSYPASYNSVVSVGALDATKTIASFSQQNDQVELSAPGVAVLSTVSYVDSTFVTAGASTYPARHVELSARGAVTATLVYGGLGDTPDASWAGRIVLVDRGTITFNQKVQNVQSSGGLACIIANNVAGDLNATLGSGNSSTIPAVSVTQTDGATLHGLAGGTVTVSTSFTQPASGYDVFDGTSMATPHAAGVAALIWSAYPGATNVQVRQALQTSAEDLGTAGRDNAYGFGLVRASAALSALAALHPASPPADHTAPVISNVVATITNAKNGSFQITWQTDEPATSDAQINTTLSTNATIGTTHTRTFRGTRGATYYFFVMSSDAAGNIGSAGPYVISL